MANKDRATNPPPEKPGGEGWLVSPEQQLLCQFKADMATVHAQWVAVRTYSWVPPRPPVPQTRRRMLRPNAIKTLGKMLKRAGPGVHHQLGEASAKRVNFDRLDRLKRAQHLTDGLCNKDPTSQHCSETAQPGNDYCCNTS